MTDLAECGCDAVVEDAAELGIAAVAAAAAVDGTPIAQSAAETSQNPEEAIGSAAVDDGTTNLAVGDSDPSRSRFAD